MGIGLGVFLLALGAILTWAVDFTFSGLDIQVIGIILMISGLVSLGLAMAYMNRSRRAVVVDAAPRDRIVETPVRERRVERDVY